MLKLGQIGLDVPFFQASLSGYSDYAMRRLARSFGAPLTFAGVMLAKSAARPAVARKPIFRPGDDEHPIGAQILGEEPEVMAKAAGELVNVGYDLIDLNFACPAPKVLRRRRGGYLLKEPARLIEIYRRVREAVDCPVLMKLRIGFDDSLQSRDNFWKIVSGVSSDGLNALIVHGRSVMQRYSGWADWKILAELKRRYPKLTVVGSGDLFEVSKTADRLKESGIDGVTIARGAIGNPWIFGRLRSVLSGRAEPGLPSLGEQGKVILEHFELVRGLYEKKKVIPIFRKFIVGYCKLHPQRRKVQKSLISAASEEELLAAIRSWYPSV